jgi:hypothetical protein
LCNKLTLILVLLFPAINWAGEQSRYDCGNATADEQAVVYLINRARSDPDAEGKRLGADLALGLDKDERARLKPRPPLALNAKLLKLAREHSEDMHKRSFFEHKNPDGKALAERVSTERYDYQLLPRISAHRRSIRRWNSKIC